MLRDHIGIMLHVSKVTVSTGGQVRFYTSAGYHYKYPSHLQVGNEHKNQSAQLHQSSALPERKSDKTALITATFMTAAVKILSFFMYTKEIKCQLTPHPVGHRK